MKLFIALTLLATPVLAQDSQDLRVTGVVTDTAGKPIEGAAVTVYLLPKGMQLDSVRARTDSAGAYSASIPISDRWNGGAYAVVVRRLGFGLVSHQKTLPDKTDDGFVAKVSFRIVPVPTTLGAVTVKGSKGSQLTSRSITAAQIQTKYSYNAIGVLIRQRPLMLGDPDRCSFAINKIYVNGWRKDLYRCWYTER